MSIYSIKDLEHLSGIKAHTLRIWEQRYSIINPKRTNSNIRYYDDQDLRLILNISLLNENGYKISKIAEMTEEERRKAVVSITEKSHKTPDQVQALTLAMIDLDEDRFEKIISTSNLQMGFERTMTQIVYPFLVKIGVLWQTGAINPAQEHFISNLIRQKLIVAIDGQVLSNKPNARKFLLFLPEGELHELSLLFSSYLIKTRNHKVVYLGQNLPFNDLIEINRVHQPDYMLTVMTGTSSNLTVQELVDKLATKFPHTQLLVTGSQVVGQDLDLKPNVILLNKLEELVDLLEDLN